MPAPVVDHAWVVWCTVNMVHEFAYDPDEAFERAVMITRTGKKKLHPSVFVDEMGEVEVHYVTGWKSLFSADEQAAIERYIACENALPYIEDVAWEDPTISNAEWTKLRAEARRLINALGGLPDNLPGRWARK